jgi:hypothetical protein
MTNWKLGSSRPRERDSTRGLESVLISTKSGIGLTDVVEGFGEKSILQRQSRATEAASQILGDEKPGKFRGIFAVFQGRGTASLYGGGGRETRKNCSSLISDPPP